MKTLGMGVVLKVWLELTQEDAQVLCDAAFRCEDKDAWKAVRPGGLFHTTLAAFGLRRCPASRKVFVFTEAEMELAVRALSDVFPEDVRTVVFRDALADAHQMHERRRAA